MSTESLEYSLDESSWPERAIVYLHPGDLVASNEVVTFKTILGSCIAVCLWDAEYRIGGMNHFVMAQGAPSSPNLGRFGIFAVPRLIDAMVAQGARAARLQAKVFGGSSMLPGGTQRANSVGMQNLRVADELLERAGIPVVARDVGGPRGRKIAFHTDDGSVSLWPI